MSSRMMSSKLARSLPIVAGSDRRIVHDWLRTRHNAVHFPSSCRSYHGWASYSKTRPLWSGFVGRPQTFFNHSRSLSSHGRDWSTALSELLWIQKPKEGSGFDNFLPRNKKSDSKDSKQSHEGSKKESGTSGSNPQKESSKGKPKDPGDASKKEKSEDPLRDFFSGGTGPFRSQQQDSSGSSDNNNFGNNGSWLSTALTLFLAYVILRMTESRRQNSEHGSNEINWKDFIHGLVETDQVEKIVISPQRTSAMVFLKPGSQGLRTGELSSSRQLADGSDLSQDGDAHHEPDDDVVEGLSSVDHPSPGQGFSLIGGGHRIVYRLSIGSVEALERKLQEVQRDMQRNPSKDIPVQYATENVLAVEIIRALPAVIVLGLTFYMTRAVLGGSGFGAGSGSGSEGGGGGIGGIFKIGKSTAKKIAKEDINVRFSDVAGCDEAKKEIMEFVEFLKDSSRFTKLGAKIPKGALLCGPPGTGKTLLAKAVAGEAGVPFYSISGSNFVEMFVGVGPARVRDLFREARKDAPCIIFIDEIDAVGRQRSRGGVSNDESDNTLNQLLVEMDGFSPSSGVVVLAATNRIDILDQALVRPGRFDRQVQVDKPDLKGRRQIFMVHLQQLTLSDEMEDIAGRLAGLTPGFVGADIANICNEAAIFAARRSADAVALEDFEKAIDRNVGGMESNKIMSKEERNIVAHHEAGHAVAGWFLEHANPLLKVTIIPRSSGALGFAQYLPKEVFLRSQDQIMDIVCTALAGRAAEEVFFGSVTNGASDDLRRVTYIVYNMIQVFGMNPRLGQLAFPKDPNAYWDERPYSEKTAKAMDEEAKSLVDAAYQKTVALIREKKDAVEKIAATLLSQETITHDDIVELIGPRPFPEDAVYQEFVEKRKNDRDENANETEEERSSDTSRPTQNEGGLKPGLA